MNLYKIVFVKINYIFDKDNLNKYLMNNAGKQVYKVFNRLFNYALIL